MRILVSGAGGFVGRHLVPRLRAEGHAVVALKRGGRQGDDRFAGPDDLADIERFADWPAGIEAVVHLAALNPKRGERQPLERLRRVNVDATVALARRAAREGVRRMVFLSSSAVHAPDPHGRPVSEASPPAPRTPYARSKAEAEAAFWGALAEGSTEGVVLRPAPVFGAGARNLTTTLARLSRVPLPLPLGGLGEPRSLVSVDSLVEAIRLSLTAPGAAGGTFLLADDGPLTPAGIVAALRAGTGRRAWVSPVPGDLLRAAARRLDKGEALAAIESGLAIDTSRARLALGWRPAEAREALKRLAAAGRI